MKLALGMIVRNEERMLRLTLPVYAKEFSIRLALDTGSSDVTPDILREYGFTVMHAQWQDDYSKARNVLLEVAEKIELDWMVQMDADECIWPKDAKSLHKMCEKSTAEIISFPRINLAAKGFVQEVGSYPDYQARCVKAQSGIRYRLPVHEVIGGEPGFASFNIFHYGWCKTPRENRTRSINYEYIKAGLPTETNPDIGDCPEYDEWLDEMRKRHTFEPFMADHPLKGKL